MWSCGVSHRPTVAQPRQIHEVVHTKDSVLCQRWETLGFSLSQQLYTHRCTDKSAQHTHTQSIISTKFWNNLFLTVEPSDINHRIPLKLKQWRIHFQILRWDFMHSVHRNVQVFCQVISPAHTPQSMLPVTSANLQVWHLTTTSSENEENKSVCLRWDLCVCLFVCVQVRTSVRTLECNECAPGG